MPLTDSYFILPTPILELKAIEVPFALRVFGASLMVFSHELFDAAFIHLLHLGSGNLFIITFLSYGLGSSIS